MPFGNDFCKRFHFDFRPFFDYNDNDITKEDIPMFTGFSNDDFEVFSVPGLDARMEKLIELIRPKLNMLGADFAPQLSILCGEEMFPHVAKHARRTVNPPKDTWVAWAKNKRGYKALPHFQIGLWGTHVFIQFTIIYECTNKQVFANNLTNHEIPLYQLVPGHYYWSMDHTKPEVNKVSSLDESSIDTITQKLRINKNAEFLCGLQINNDDPILTDGEKFYRLVEETFETLLPLYQMSFES
jgi:uncharacterized protein YktB (UPF0637 family)